MANHINYERAGLLSTIEQIAAKLLYVYGVVQLYYSPSLETLITSIGSRKWRFLCGGEWRC